MKRIRLDAAVIAAAVLVPAIAYFGFFRDRIAELNRLRQDEILVKEQTLGGGKTAADATVVRNNVRKVSRRLDAFMGSVTTEDEALRGVDAVLQHAKTAGVNVQSLRPGKQIEGKTLNCVPIELTAAAEFSRLYDFFVRIEHDKMVMTLDKMELRSEPPSDKCSVKLELRIYFIKPAPGKERPA